MAATFLWVPDDPQQISSATRITAVQFGDGYQQRRADGINTLDTSIMLTFDHRTKAEIDAIEQFLLATNGTASFEITLPIGNTVRVVLKDQQPWQRSDHSAGLASLTLTLARVYEP